MSNPIHRPPSLRPCPFCGGKASIDSRDGRTFYVECNGCLALVRYYNWAGPMPFQEPIEAAQAWNKRTDHGH